jgi:hypothetical protein
MKFKHSLKSFLEVDLRKTCYVGEFPLTNVIVTNLVSAYCGN